MEHGTAGPPTTDSLREMVAAATGVAPEEVTGDANLVLLGVGSLEMMRLATHWRRQGLAVEFRELAATPTIDAWAKHFAAAWAARDSGRQDGLPDPSDNGRTAAGGAPEAAGPAGSPSPEGENGV